MNRDERLAVAEYLGTDAPRHRSARRPRSAPTARSRSRLRRARAGTAGARRPTTRAINRRSARARRRASPEPHARMGVTVSRATSRRSRRRRSSTATSSSAAPAGSCRRSPPTAAASSGHSQANGPVRTAPLAASRDGTATCCCSAISRAGSTRSTPRPASSSGRRKSRRTTRRGSRARRPCTTASPTCPCRRGRSRAPAIPITRAARSAAASSPCACATARSSGKTYLTDAPRELGKNGTRRAAVRAVRRRGLVDADRRRDARPALRRRPATTTRSPSRRRAMPWSRSRSPTAASPGLEQITAGDAYNGSCNREHRSNCPLRAGTRLRLRLVRRSLLPRRRAAARGAEIRHRLCARCDAGRARSSGRRASAKAA